ncbi:MAG TPA: hypothetical protein DCS07_12780 [Bdellovibrionales bacterium]|nr:hypothetical protein [Bdellovibrionales bacterium]
MKSEKLTDGTYYSPAGQSLNQPSAASGGYSCWQLFTVQRINSIDGYEGALPVMILPKSLVGKTVKVTIEEQL